MPRPPADETSATSLCPVPPLPIPPSTTGCSIPNSSVSLVRRAMSFLPSVRLPLDAELRADRQGQFAERPGSHVVVQTPTPRSLQDLVELLTLQRRIEEALARIKAHEVPRCVLKLGRDAVAP